jgi:ribosomal protein S18 acetylase RimI-like enzyme
MEQIRVIKAKRIHVPQVIELWKDFMDFHADVDPFYTRNAKAHIGYKKHLMKSVGLRTKQLFLALDGKQVVGYIYVEIAKHAPVFVDKYYGYICDMYTQPAYRRQGLGKLMYNAAIEWCKKKGMTHIELGVATKNRVANSFWRKMGFTERMRRMYLDLM